jgi:peptide/nickel transport system substrate-binding protein
VLDPSTRLDEQVGLLQQLRLKNEARLFTAQSNVLEWLGLGISPASYDDGFNVKKDRPDFFSDKRTRQAIALCLDRQKVVDTVLFGLSQVPDTYVPPDHPLHNANVETYEFNPDSGNQILADVGWLDQDHDPATPRRAATVTNVPVDTPLVLNYYTTSATQRHQVVEIFAQSLAQCGIGLNVVYYDASAFYLPGQTGPLFGRQFDLAEYSLGVDSLQPQCSWFTSSQIPGPTNNWIGTNLTGYKNPKFDADCEKTRQAVSTDPEYTLHQEAQAIFAADIPAIPLYVRLKVAATRPDFCGFILDGSSFSALASIETFDYGASCGS